MYWFQLLEYDFLPFLCLEEKCQSEKNKTFLLSEIRKLVKV